MRGSCIRAWRRSPVYRPHCSPLSIAVYSDEDRHGVARVQSCERLEKSNPRAATPASVEAFLGKPGAVEVPYRHARSLLPARSCRSPASRRRGKRQGASRVRRIADWPARRTDGGDDQHAGPAGSDCDRVAAGKTCQRHYRVPCAPRFEGGAPESAVVTPARFCRICART